jgi:competence protein ComEA
MNDTRADWRIFDSPDALREPGGGPTGDPTSPARRPADTPPARDRIREAAPAVVPLVLAAAAGAVAAAALVLAFTGSGAATVVVDQGSPAGGGSVGRAADDASAAPGAPGSASGDPAASVADPASGDGGVMLVDVEGGVARPGVVRLAAGARVGDAVAAAGGYGPTVDVVRAASDLNLAARLQDGDRIRVPALGDPSTGTGTDPSVVTSGAGGAGAAIDPAGGATGGAVRGSAGDGSGLVDLNGATAAELDTLPGIGPATAAKIIDARAAAPFVRVSDLRDRKVVSAATYTKIEDLVTVGP